MFPSFFARGRETVYVFGLIDYAGIFLFIAGSYSPVLGILFHGETWARTLLGTMWSVAFMGIFTAAFYRGPGQTALRLSLFLTMGWTGLLCLARMGAKVGRLGVATWAGGGVLYTAGVPWFVRGRHTYGFPDHAIWHVWVIMGSLSQFLCIYLRVVELPPAQQSDAALPLIAHAGFDLTLMSSPRKTSSAAADAPTAASECFSSEGDSLLPI
uniref:Uncharacterized protein n=1 Tax=Zooxanthella nutricula TaxID=1333877 RepID=A0A7S2JMI2_9DINO